STDFMPVGQCLILSIVSASCPKDCQCPLEVPTCADSVSLVLDSCGCCKVCARQLFEDCSKTQPCDAAKGLECTLTSFPFSVFSTVTFSLFITSAFPCFCLTIYQNGETFHPNCKHQCTCIDGAVGCVSLCPREFSLPLLGCAKLRRVKVPGGCCEQLVCSEETEAQSAMIKKHRRKSHSVDHMFARGVQCMPQTTAWSPCSKSCGSGVSTRLTNRNKQCKLVKETRICEIRPCKQLTSKKGQKCSHRGKASHPVHLSYAGCRSLKKLQRRYCGSCSDGQCCRPHRTRTMPLHFRCKNGETFRRMVMTIKSCKCNLDLFLTETRGRLVLPEITLGSTKDSLVGST
uniref:CCN family member 1 n=1 Tax=Neolamprologus brichardi TaxID=32507 RepID=A0A3Q4GN77_NEOBR